MKSVTLCGRNDLGKRLQKLTTSFSLLRFTFLLVKSKDQDNTTNSSSMNSPMFQLSEQETILANVVYMGDYMIDSWIDRPV